MFLNPTQYYLPQGLPPQYTGMPFGGSQAGLFGQPGNGQGYPFAQPQQWGGNSFAGAQHNPLQQIVPMVGQLAQHISIHSAVTQQIAVLLHQVAHQLAAQSYQGGFAGQSLGGGSPFLGGGPGQSFGQNPFAFGPGGYAGFGAQPQSWGAGRPQTVQ